MDNGKKQKEQNTNKRKAIFRNVYIIYKKG